MIDDDNWVEKNWIEKVGEIMDSNKAVGALGGCSTSHSEISPPKWFQNYEMCYAVGVQGTDTEDIADTRSFLWGVGLCIRRAAWEDVVASGFSSNLSDRNGKIISSGGDSEMCRALRACGWRLFYSAEIKFVHFIHKERMKWSYLTRLIKSFGAASLITEVYSETPVSERRRKWWYPIITATKRLCLMPKQTLVSLLKRQPGYHGT